MGAGERKGSGTKKGEKQANERELRTPILAVLGHIDHGKTTLLDAIRGTAVAEREAGRVTQHIGATEIPIDAIKRICSPLKRSWDDIKVPGLLFIDTPGHHAFASLRKRGSALADIAVLVVDVIEGFQPQTYESLNVLRMLKTPFVVALNKIDRISGWISRNKPFVMNYREQNESAREELDDKVYKIVETLFEEGFSAERYDRIRDFTRNVSIVPLSAKTGEGIPDLLLVLIGLSQRFLEKSLRLHAEGAGEGTILEKKEERGLGTTIDVILYDGKLSVGDAIVVGSTKGEPIVTKVKALLKPEPLREMAMERKFRHIKSVTAAAGVKIVAPMLEDALPGAPLIQIRNAEEEERAKERIRKEFEAMQIETQPEGVVIKADTMGSLEALAYELHAKKIPISKADVGNISKRDVIDATAVKDEFLRVILGFNVPVNADAKEEAKENDVKIFTNNVIYRLIEDYELWVAAKKEAMLREKFKHLTTPAAVRILAGHIFRQSKPAIFGVEVLAGKIKPGVALMTAEGKDIGKINEIQDKGESIQEATAGMRVAISMKKPIFGRHIHENDILYTNLNAEEVEALRELYDFLTEEERKILDEVLRIKGKGALGFER